MDLKRIFLLTVSALAAGIPTVTAEASTVTLEGDTLVLRAAPGEKNWLTVGPNDDEPGMVLVSDVEQPSADPALCSSYSTVHLSCTSPAGGVRLEAGDRDDIIDVGELPGLALVGDAGAGDDAVRGPAFGDTTTTTLIGGPGNDRMTGGAGPDAIDAGAGDDEVDGRGGADELRAGDGNDKLMPDDWEEVSTDVVDGGAGYDQIEMGWTAGSNAFQPPIDVSIDGAANDGRPGENDNVTGIERLYSTAPATFTGSDGPDELTVFQTDKASRLIGRGGDDKLSGFDVEDVIDGGAGADLIQGGYGHDTITGGPGRDSINADVSGTTCHWIQCRNPYGNDTIDARDGEADDVTCGIGTDSVTADDVDTVAADCETVQRGGAPKPGEQQPQPGPEPDEQRPVAGAAITQLRARRRGAVVVVTGRATGTAKVTVTATRGGRRVARRSAAVRSGRFTARLRIKRGARLRIAAKAGTSTASLTVR